MLPLPGWNKTHSHLHRKYRRVAEYDFFGLPASSSRHTQTGRKTGQTSQHTAPSDVKWWARPPEQAPSYQQQGNALEQWSQCLQSAGLRSSLSGCLDLLRVLLLFSFLHFALFHLVWRQHSFIRTVVTSSYSMENEIFVTNVMMKYRERQGWYDNKAPEKWWMGCSEEERGKGWEGMEGRLVLETHQL